MDLTLFKALNGLAYHHDHLEDFLRWFALNGQYLFVALLAVMFLARGRWASRNARHGVAAAGFSVLLALGVAQVIAGIVDRPRPFVAHPAVAHLYIPPSTDPSFPSDHATAAFAIAVSIALRNRRIGWLAIGMATLLSLSRVAVGTHYPGDVLAGAALGTLAALFFWIPAVRDPLHRLADWAASIYERIATRLLGGRWAPSR